MSGFQKGVDDWICPDIDCKNVNYARRTHCHRCQVERKDAKKATAWDKKKLGTEIGKQAAEKSRGLFNADDWQCSQCSNVNWSRRQSCNMCNAPKFTDVEERTGTGGGYNERTSVEYKDRVPSDDDEYDEFGRRKKKLSKRRSPSPSPVQPKQKPEPTKAEGDEDDEEDDDDEDGDLSKYNLWDSDGEDKKESPSTSKNDDRPTRRSCRSPTNSHSRSPRNSRQQRERKRSHNRSRSYSSDSSRSSSSSGHRKRRR